MSKGLEALKVLVMSSTTLFNTKEQITNAKETIEKVLKALEIIKREPSMVGWQIGYEDYEDYLDNTPEEQRLIKSKEEFDLLKEVLL